jgi:CheY-like chemotaxis protein
VPIIGLSAYASAADERQAIEAGFTRHLGKPADYDTLVSTIAGVVQRIRT